jgi:hypothetical protein
MRQVGYAVELDLERDGDLLFHLFGGMARPLRNDLDVGVSNIRIGLDGKIVERDDAPYKEDNCEAEYQNAIVQRQINQVTDHLVCVASDSKNSVTASRRSIKFFYRDAARR